MKLQSFAAAAALATVAAAKKHRCGSVEPPNEMRLNFGESSFRGSAYPNSSNIAVDVYVHVVTSQASEGQYTQEQVDAQMEVMNSAYAPSGVSFNTIDTDFTVNDEWSAASLGSQAEADMKSSLKQGTYADLDLYLLSDLGDDLLGFCYFPKENPSESDLALDGCVILAGSMPGGDVPNYDLGYTSVHETGHWFGLFHVFQGDSCRGRGDFIRDTAQQSIATEGCPQQQDSCPGKPGLDNIHNYMDYSYDACMTEFTEKQGKRIQTIYGNYRAGN